MIVFSDVYLLTYFVLLFFRLQLNVPQAGGLYGSGNQLKRPANAAHPQQPIAKKPKLNYLKDLSTADAAKYATLAEYEFFDSVSRQLGYKRCIHAICIESFHACC